MLIKSIEILVKQSVHYTAAVVVMVLALAGLTFAASPQLVNYQVRPVDGSGDREKGKFKMPKETL